MNCRCEGFCGIPILITRCWEEFWSCGVWSGCSGVLDVLNGCLQWQELGLDDSQGLLKTCVPKCICWGKRAKINMLVYTAAGSDRCQLKLPGWKCLCVEIYIAAMLLGIFFFFFSDCLCKHMKKKRTFENCLCLLSLAYKDKYNCIDLIAKSNVKMTKEIY